jgi:glucokinase
MTSHPQAEPRPAEPRAAVPHLDFPVLVADIGGTNARFAILTAPDGEVVEFPTAPTAEHPDPADAIERTVFATSALRPKTAIMALAGPITGERVPLTNCPWVVEPRVLIERLGLSQVLLVNDFEALALALPSLGEADLLQIGGGAMKPNAAKAVVGPGTGLGVAILLHAVGMWIPVPGEGGHVAFNPETERDIAIWRNLTRLDGHVSAEWVLCGSGIVRLYQAIARTDGKPAPLDRPGAIGDAAAAGDPVAVETLTLFATYLGRLAGDLALTSLARGGVFLGGGVAQKIQAFLTSGEFRAAFEAKPPHQKLVGGIPTYLITHPRPAVIGLVAYARDPGHFGIELDGRHWRA